MSGNRLTLRRLFEAKKFKLVLIQNIHGAAVFFE